MELRHLRYFIAVAKHESVRKASQQIHVTQPAISRQIHQLEKELGVRLFERTPSGLKFTDAGFHFLREARETLFLLDLAVQATKQTAAGLRGTLRIGFIENAVWDGLVPDTFSSFQADAPDVRVELSPLNTLVQMEQLQSKALDGGFINLLGPLPTNIEAIPLITNDVMLAAPLAWGLSENTSVSAEILNHRPIVIFPRAMHPAYYDLIMAACLHRGVTLDVVQEGSTGTAIMALVSAGVGGALVNSANRGRPPASVALIDFTDLSIPMPFAFVYMKSNVSRVLKRFVSRLREVLCHGAP